MTVTASVQLVGVYLVFASLIVPALAARHLNGNVGLMVAFAVGVAGYAIGLLLSAMFDLPSGALIVWTIAACAIAVSTFTARTSTDNVTNVAGKDRSHLPAREAG